MSKKIFASLIAIPAIALGGCEERTVQFQRPQADGTEVVESFSLSNIDDLNISGLKCAKSPVSGISSSTCSFIADKEGDFDGKKLRETNGRGSSFDKSTQYRQTTHRNSTLGKRQELYGIGL